MTGGPAIRSGTQIMALADCFDVSVAVATEMSIRDAEARIPPEVRAACSSLSVTATEPAIARLLAKAGSARNRMLIQAAWPLPLMHARARPGLMPLADTIAATHPGRRFDVLHCYKLATAPIARMLRRRGLTWAHSVVDLDDYESFAKSRYVRDFRHVLGLQYSAASRLDAMKLWMLEAIYVPRFDDGYVSSFTDRATLERRFPGVNWFVVPNVVPEPPPQARVRTEKFTFIFVGTLSYEPNADGLRFFAREVLPILRSTAIAPFRVIVAGRQAGPGIRKIASSEGWELVPDPPSVAPYYAQADAALVPIRSGSGTRIKLLEAFSYGVPVVSTELGAEGLELEGEQDLLFANDAASFAAACARLIADPVLRERLASRGRAVFEQRYSLQSLRDLVPTLHPSPLSDRQVIS